MVKGHYLDTDCNLIKLGTVVACHVTCACLNAVPRVVQTTMANSYYLGKIEPRFTQYPIPAVLTDNEEYLANNILALFMNYNLYLRLLQNVLHTVLHTS